MNNTQTFQRRVVCAAARLPTGEMILSPRHFDPVFHAQRARESFDSQAKWPLAEQGFIDQRGNFMTRQEAFDVAEAAGQIIRLCGCEHQRYLYSENLY